MEFKIKKVYFREEIFKIEENDKKVIKFIKKIKKLIKSNSLKESFKKKFLITVVYIRDKIINKKIQDYDFILNTDIFFQIYSLIKKNETNLEINELKLHKFPKPINKNLLVIKVKGLHFQIKEIDSDLKKDFESRDFTINSLYYNFFFDYIIDFRNSMVDLRNNRLVAINNVYDTFNDSFPRFFRFARFLVDFSTENKLFLYVKNYFTNEKYLDLISDKFKDKDNKKQLGKIFYYHNTGEIIKKIMELGIFEFFYDKSFFQLEKGNKKSKLYFFIIELMNKVDKFLLNGNFLKDKFDLNNKQFRNNIKCLKTNVIVYCFHHPNFFRGRLLYDIPKKSFNFKRSFIPPKFYKNAYKLEKRFNEKNFDNFDFEIKNNLESKFPICKLITVLPFLNCLETDFIDSDEFILMLKGIKLRKDEKNIYHYQNSEKNK